MPSAWRLLVCLALLALSWAAAAQIAQPQSKLELGITADLEELRNPQGRGYSNAVQSFRKHLIEPPNGHLIRWPSQIVCQHSGDRSHDVVLVLMRFLHDPSPNVRTMAIFTLGCLKNEVSSSKPALINSATFDKNANVRRAAIDLLGSIANPKALVPVMLRALKSDQDRAVQASAARALTRIDKETKLSANALLDIVKHHPSASVRAEAVSALAEIEGAVPAVVLALSDALLHDSDSSVRLTAVKGLSGMQKSEGAAPAVISALSDALLHDSDSSVRLNVLKELSGMPKSKEVGAALVGALRREPSPEAQKMVIAAFRAAHPVPQDAVLGLIEALKLRGAGSDAAAALQEIPLTDAELGVLLEALNDTDAQVRARAAFALIRKPGVKRSEENRLTPPGPESLPSPRKPNTDGIYATEFYSSTVPGGLPTEKILLEEVWGGKVDEDGGFSFPTSVPVARSAEDVAKKNVAVSLHLLNDSRPEARVVGAYMLGAWANSSDEAVTALIRALRDDNDTVRQTAAMAVGTYGQRAQVAVPVLVKLLHDDRAQGVRQEAANALCGIGFSSRSVLSDLIRTLREDSNEGVRAAVILALHCLDPDGKESLAPIIGAVKDRNNSVRIAAFSALGAYGAKAEKALPLLTEELKKEEASNAELQRIGQQPGTTHFNDELSVADAIYRIALSLRDAGKTDALDSLKAASTVLEGNPNLKSQYGFGLKVSIQYLEVIKQNSWQERLFGAIREHSWLARALSVGVAYTALLLILCPIFWVRPFWIHRIDRWLDPLSNKVRFKAFDLEVALHYVFLVGFFRHRDSVLDSWVEEYASQTMTAFGQIETVRERRLHLDAPVELNGHSLPFLTAASLREALGDAHVRVLVCGMGGVGKTSLACQLAGWAIEEKPSLSLRRNIRMVPVLIEEDCDTYEGVEPSRRLTVIVRDKLQRMAGLESEAKLSETFVERLLERQRILLIVDGLSELSFSTRSIVQPKQLDFVANCLVVTSRNEDEPLEGTTTVIKPSLLKKEALSLFIGRYLAECGAKELFDEAEFHRVCLQLVEIVGDREVTAFLAKLYADHVIGAKASGRGLEKPSDTIDLVLSYVVEMNDKVVENGQDKANVLAAAKVLAWECLKEHFFPNPGYEERAFAEISERLGVTREAAINLVRYFENRLRLIQGVGPTGERFKFALDPVAENLAALHIVEVFGPDKTKWDDLLKGIIEAPENLGAVQGFLTALQDCCRSRGHLTDVPQFVATTLASHVSSPAKAIPSQKEQHPEAGAVEQPRGVQETKTAETPQAPAAEESLSSPSDHLSVEGVAAKPDSRISRTSASWHAHWMSIGIVATVLIADRLTKWAIVRKVPWGRTVSLVPRVFDLTHVENPGVAFNWLSNSKHSWMPHALVAFSGAALLLIGVSLWALWKRPEKPSLLIWVLSLIAGGAAGNLFDRVATGRVVNFLDFHIGRHHWPPFNVADSAIVVGLLLLILDIFPISHFAATAILGRRKRLS